MDNPIKENIKTFYRKYAGEFDEKIASLDIYNDTYDTLLGKIQDDAAILDLACGPGNVSGYLKRSKPGLEITGVDISEEMIEIAKTRIKGGTFMVADICRVDFKTQFDCVVCAFAIPYLDHRESARVAGIIRQSMKPDGHFYLSFIKGSKQGYEKQSFTDDDTLFIYYHSSEAVLKILDQQALSVTEKFEIDYPGKDGTITKEIVYIGGAKAV